MLTIPIVVFIIPAMTGWNAAAAERIVLTTAVLRQLKEVRFLGLGGTTFALIKQLRNREVTTALLFRRLIFFIILFCKLSHKHSYMISS